MRMNVNEKSRIVSFWLTNEEKNNKALRKELASIYKEYSDNKYMVAVFESGSEDLYEQTLELLLYNRKKVAELEVEKEKQTQKAI